MTVICPVIALFFMTVSVAYAQSNSDDLSPVLEKGAGSKSSIAVNLSVTIDGSTDQNVTCIQGKSVSIVALADSPDDPSAAFVYTFGWRFSTENSWRILQFKGDNNSIFFQVPPIPSDAPLQTHIELYFVAYLAGTSDTGTRAYRNIYVETDTVTDIYDALVSEYSIPDGINSDVQSSADDLLSTIQSNIQTVIGESSIQLSFPDPTSLFTLGSGLIPPQIMAFVPLLLLCTFLIWVLRR